MPLAERCRALACRSLSHGSESRGGDDATVYISMKLISLPKWLDAITTTSTSRRSTPTSKEAGPSDRRPHYSCSDEQLALDTATSATKGCASRQPQRLSAGGWARRGEAGLAWAISASICWAFARPWPVVPRCVADLFGYTSARGNQGERRKGKAQTPRALQGRKRGTSRAPGLEQVHRKGKREWIFRPRRGRIIRKRPQEERPIPPAPLAPEQILSAVGMASGSEEQQQQSRTGGDQASKHRSGSRQ